MVAQKGTVAQSESSATEIKMRVEGTGPVIEYKKGENVSFVKRRFYFVRSRIPRDQTTGA